MGLDIGFAPHARGPAVGVPRGQADGRMMRVQRDASSPVQ